MEHSNPPNFQAPKTTVAPTVQSLLNDNVLFLESGISYCKYVPLKPMDHMELIKNSKIVSYFFRDQTCFINTKRIFLELEFICVNEDDSPLKQADNVSACNVLSHSIIESCVLNIGKKVRCSCNSQIPADKHI